MLAIYLLTLFVSSGMTGVYVRHVVAEQGFITGFSGGTLLTVGVACAYASTQLAYVTFLRLLWPPKTNMPLLGESISHACCVFLLPYLMGIQINWPHPILKEVEPLIFLGTFAAIHSLFKVITLFSFLRSIPGKRITVVFWAVATCATILTGYLCSSSWIKRVERAQNTVVEEAKPYRIDGATAMARALPESCDLTVPLSPGANSVLAMRWANLPDAPQENRVGRIHVTIDFESESGKTYDTWIELGSSQWLDLHLPAESVPDDATACTVMWGVEKPPKWRALTKLRPALRSDRKVLLSGPMLCAALSAQTTPSVVVVVVDGLGAYHFTGLGTTKAYTPNLAVFANGSLSFLQAYTTAPESAAASMSLLTGVGPLRHGYLGTRLGPTPRSLRAIPEVLREAGYATAAFSEGDRFDDLTFERSFARGFDLVDSSAHFEDTSQSESSVIAAPATVSAGNEETQAEPPVFGSSQTLKRASEWIKANQSLQTFTFVRLTELRDLTPRIQYGLDSASQPPRELYAAALFHLDHVLSQFLSSVQHSAGGANTFIVVAGAYGTDFASGATPSASGLTEPSLRVPLLVRGPGIEPNKEGNLVSIEDVAPTLAARCSTSLGSAVAPKDLLGDAVAEEPVSVTGNPLTITSRNDLWRIVWETGRTPFEKDASGPQGFARLYNLSRYTPSAGLSDQAPRNTELVTQWVTVLQRFLDVQATEW
ncbi:MAG: sulfatase-like hydrolase/transferase [Candidatus Hydrogenedentes bacterium]|nr:sulfatase-like hydrolase/transferase [Candidatus Hydrogenedentota bacterium]